MADYYAILKKTLGGLPNASEQVRQTVYEKARGTIERQLNAMDPKPSEALIARQMDMLGSAIEKIEGEYEGAASAGEKIVAPEVPVTAAATAPPIEPVSEPQAEPTISAEEAAPTIATPSATEPALDPSAGPTVNPAAPQSMDYSETIFAESASVGAVEKSRGIFARMLPVLLAVGVIGGGAYALWLNKDALLEAFDNSLAEDTSQEQPKPVETAKVETPEAEPEKPIDVAPEAERQVRIIEGTDPNTSTEEDKDNTQLTSEGRTVEAEPVTQQEETPTTAETVQSEETQTNETVETPTPSEQTTTEQQVSEVGAEDPKVEENQSETEETQTPAPTTTTAPAVAQKAFLYEEGNSGSEASRDKAAIIWSLDQESINGGAPEAVIKGQLDIPGRGLSMTMSIKRNLDSSLPASHIVELLFKVPPDFTGGNIGNVARFVMKSNEQDRGNGLVAVPAKISDGFFLIALNNLEQAKKTNRDLLLNNSWIDIPVGYTTGRRALVTLEKGAIGNKVFQDAFADWDKR